MTNTIRHLAFGAATVLSFAGCGGDDTATGSESDASAGECPVGQEGCPCAAGDACVVGLMCVSNACIDPGGLSDGTGGTSGGASSSSTSGATATATATAPTTDASATAGTGPDSGLCSDNSECGDDEVCVSSECAWIGDLYFEVRVYSFKPPSCDDGWGDAELYFDYWEGDEFMSSSAISGCPGEWSDEVLVYDSLLAFKLSFWESDAISDDHITTLCWGGDECEEIPYSLLRDGGWAGLDGSATYYLHLTFDPIAP